MRARLALTGALAAALAALAVLAVVLSTSQQGGACSGGEPPATQTPAGAWVATAYGPPWGGIQGNGITATGLNLTAGQQAFEVAVDPKAIALRSYVHVQPNPFGTSRRVLRRRHRRRDHRQARRHLRLARPRRARTPGESAPSP